MSDRPDGLRQQFIECLVALAIPLLLVVPAMLIVTHQTRGLRAAEAVLRREIDQVDRAIATIRDLDRIKAEYLTRRSVAIAIAGDRLRAVHVLNAIGALPPEVRLRSAAISQDALTLAGTSTDASASIRAVAALHAAGLVDVSLADPAAKGSPPLAFEIRAIVPDPGEVSR